MLGGVVLVHPATLAPRRGGEGVGEAEEGRWKTSAHHESWLASGESWLASDESWLASDESWLASVLLISNKF